jgi:hypothetical protein
MNMNCLLSYLGRITDKNHRLRVFENGVLGRIFGLRKDEVTGGR